MFEVLIVVAILAMISGGIAVAALKYGVRAKIQHTATEARIIRTAVNAWIFEGIEGCPLVADLRQKQYLESGTRSEDPWGKPYRVQCHDSVVVWSCGPDRREGTADDIVVPNDERERRQVSATER